MAPRLASIAIHPVKSLSPTFREASRILPSGGLENDRRFALFDAAGKLVHGKRTPLVHALIVSIRDDGTRMTIARPGGEAPRTWQLPAEKLLAEAYFSEHFGFPVTLRENREAGFPDDTLSSGPTIIAAETLETVAGWFGLSYEETRDRFRANLVVEGGGPFWDDRLAGPPGRPVAIRIGDLLLFGTNRCARCVVPSRDSASGEVTAGFVSTFTTNRRKFLPEWAEPEQFDHFYRLAVNTRLYAPAEGATIRVGDAVEIVG